MGRNILAGLAALICAGGGAWAGQRLGGSAATAGIGAAIGAVSGAFAPIIVSLRSERVAARRRAASTVVLPRIVHLPSQLLDPHRKTVLFTGRDRELADLIAWCENGSALGLRLIIGPGGVGKTRLAIQFTDLAHELGWRCYWVGSDQEEGVLASIRAVTSGRVLLIVDYAETRAGLAKLLRAAATDQGTQLRILLLARSIGPWWEQLSAGEPAVRRLVTAAGSRSHQLRYAVDADVSDEELIRQAIPLFARELHVRPPEEVEIVPATRRVRILELHATALVAVLDSVKVSALSQPRVEVTDILEELLRHERRYWLGSAQAQGLTIGVDGLNLTGLGYIVAAGCLLGAANQDEALDMLERVPYAPRSLKLATWLRELYPPEPGINEWLGALQPDRLAELHTVTQLGQSEAFARRCLTGLNERQSRRAIILLARAATEHDTAGQLLSNLLPLVANVVADIQAPLPILISIANSIPYPSESLAAAHAAIIRRILDNLPPGSRTPERCQWLSEYGSALIQIDRPAEALLATEEAVAICRELAADNPDLYRHNLADLLDDLADAYLNLDRVGDALPYAEEAVAICRELTRGSTVAEDRDLDLFAFCLYGLCTIYYRLGRVADALPYAEEMVAARRELAAGSRYIYGSSFAQSLNSLAEIYWELDRSAESLTLANEAVAIYRELTASNPNLYRGELAFWLNSLALVHTKLGHETDALAHAEEAVMIYRDLTAGNADPYGPSLIDALDSLSAAYAEMGRSAETLQFVEEAVAIRRELATTRPGLYRSDLAEDLFSLGSRYRDLGRFADARVIVEEAVAIYRDLATANPDLYRRDLASSLNNLAGAYLDLDRPVDALPHAEEAVRIERALSLNSPDPWDLVQVMYNLGLIYSELDRRLEALQLIEEAVAIYQTLSPDNSDSYRSDFARHLNSLARKLSGKSQPKHRLPKNFRKTI